jgi:hypothetical protein
MRYKDFKKNALFPFMHVMGKGGCPDFTRNAGLQPGTSRPKGRRYIQIRTAPTGA